MKQRRFHESITSLSLLLILLQLIQDSQSIWNPTLISPKIQWRFHNYGTGKVLNTGWGGSNFDLDYQSSQNQDMIGRFTTYADKRFGVQYSGQFSAHGFSDKQLIGQPNFFYHMWFWTAVDNEAFTLFSVGPDQTATDESSNAFTATNPPTGSSSKGQYFSLGVQGDGYYFIEIRLYNQTTDTESLIKERATNLKVAKGWNYVAVLIDEIYEYSYLTMYSRSEADESSTLKYNKYESVFFGYYYYHYTHSPAANYPLDEIVVLGCKTYFQWAHSSTWGTTAPFLTNSATPADADPVYGLCMKGWIHTIEIWTTCGSATCTIPSATPTSGYENKNWDYVFNADLTTERAALDSLIQDFIYRTNPADKSFKIGSFGYTTTPYPLYINPTVYADFRKEKTIIFEWDSSISTGIANTGATRNPYIIDLAANIGCTMIWDATTSTVDPYYQPDIGRITTNTTKYLKCSIAAQNALSKMAFFPAMFTMEAWIRMDPIDIRPNGYISQVFSLYDGTIYRLGFAVSNTFLRVYLDDTIEDIHYMFNETRSYWHYIAVSYTRHFERETIMQVWIDQAMIYNQKVFDWFIFKMDTATYELHISKDFPGIVRKARINGRSHVEGYQDTPLMIVTDQSKCNKKGDTQCSFCDFMNNIHPTAYGNIVNTPASFDCFPICPDFGYFVSGATLACTECHNSCRYCRNTDGRDNCYLCNSTALFVQDTSVVAPANTYVESSNILTCECAEGTITNDQKFCHSCDKRCAVCMNQLNVDCDMCAPGAYKMYKSECGIRCPENYIPDDENHICSFDMTLLHTPAKPVNTQGCMDGFFWNWATMNCTPCSYACLTCEFDGNQCTSCPTGRYLTDGNRCELCETFWKSDMIVGSSGKCIETCGDGKNFGMQMCDDGNQNGGDGCSPQCLVEKGYTCSGGYPYSKDRCTYVHTEILGVTVNRYNDVIVKFSRPVFFKNGSLTNNDLQLSYKNQIAGQSILNYTVIKVDGPSRFLYLKTKPHEDIIGGIYRDNFFELRYMNTKKIFDTNGKEIKASSYAKGILNSVQVFKDQDKLDVEEYTKYILWFIAGGIFFWLTITLITNRSVLPSVFLLLAIQQFFYIGCQDLFFDQKLRYFFTFFRIFRFEHTKLTNFFSDFDLLDTSYLAKVFYNQNFGAASEVQYHNIHLQNNLKMLIFAAYFAMMPVVLAIDFFIIQCTPSCKFYNWLSEKFAQSYFFSGPLMLIMIFGFPFAVSVMTELRFLTIENEIQIYSAAVCAAIFIILLMYWLSLWVVVFTHYRHKHHPLVAKKFGFILASIKNQVNEKEHTVFSQSIIALYVTKRFAAACVIGLLCRYTLGPILILALFQGIMILYLGVYRPFKYTVSNFVAIILESFLLAVYLECVGLSDKYSSKASLFWILISTVFGFVLVADLAFILFGWQKLSDFLYFQRFGIKKSFGVGTPRERRVIVDSHRLKDMSLNGEGLSRFEDGHSQTFADISKLEDLDEQFEEGGPEMTVGEDRTQDQSNTGMNQTETSHLFKLNKFPRTKPIQSSKPVTPNGKNDPETIVDVYMGDFKNPYGTSTNEMLSTPMDGDDQQFTSNAKLRGQSKVPKSQFMHKREKSKKEPVKFEDLLLYPDSKEGAEHQSPVIFETPAEQPDNQKGI